MSDSGCQGLLGKQDRVGALGVLCMDIYWAIWEGLFPKGCAFKKAWVLVLLLVLLLGLQCCGFAGELEIVKVGHSSARHNAWASLPCRHLHVVQMMPCDIVNMSGTISTGVSLSARVCRRISWI